MQILYEISKDERISVKKYLSDGISFDDEQLKVFLAKYEIALSNTLNQVTELKMDLDDRDSAFKLFLNGTLKKEDLENLINNG